MDILYHAILTVFEGKTFFAPVKNPQRIVDMGTGTGIWAFVCCLLQRPRLEALELI